MKRTPLLGAVLVLFSVSSAIPQEATPTKTPEPWPDFTFKRVKAPEPGAAKRILVTIEPDAVIAAPPPPEPERPVELALSPSGFEWFWAQVSPKLDYSGALRMQNAMAQISRGPSGQPVPGPRLDTLAAISKTHAREILSSTIGTSVSPALALAVIAVESSGNPTAVSSAGAQGLMQLIPATADRFGVANAMDPEQNIGGGVAYLDWLIDEFEGDALLALAGYNAGENAVKKHGGVPPYPETRAYVPKVLAAWQVARALCRTPPELMTDGCVFNLSSP
ncbi:MAG: lytic transglycosylase domain-containing protein [Rhodobacteraceae bacterium]|nr:lytic transglycosylase domain-containing protein [Paracoccaceae bacterium]